VNGQVSMGRHVVKWMGCDDEGSSVASGVYIYRLTSERTSISRKMLLLK